jgi:uncharacterized protein
MVPAVIPFPYPWSAGLLARLDQRFALERRDGAHDLAHVLRVAQLARTIAREEGADPEACVASALLHDLVHLPKNHPDSPRTARLGADLALAWCREVPELAGRAELIAGAVATHSFSGGEPPASLVGAVLQDADRLEALGAIGLARVFATGGAMGGGLWHPEDPWGRGRPLDDKRWSLDHFPLKLLKLKDGMNTAAGRRLAAGRDQVLRAFLEALAAELDYSIQPPPSTSSPA